MLFVPQWLQRSSSPPTRDDDIQHESLAEKLQHYKAHGDRPPSSRIDPTLQQRPFQPTTITELWKYGAFLVSKGLFVSLQDVSSMADTLPCDI
jgi:hypothetical protein